MRFALFVHDAPADTPIDLGREYAQLRELFR
jgi:hypothetical protein